MALFEEEATFIAEVALDETKKGVEENLSQLISEITDSRVAATEVDVWDLARQGQHYYDLKELGVDISNHRTITEVLTSFAYYALAEKARELAEKERE